MPNTCFTPSASRHSTKTSEALRAAMFFDSTVGTMRDSRHKVAAHINGPAQVWDAGSGVRLAGTALNGVTGGRYHGAIELRPGPGGLMAINLVGLDDYVKGVVPGEMPSLWSSEA